MNIYYVQNNMILNLDFSFVFTSDALIIWISCNGLVPSSRSSFLWRQSCQPPPFPKPLRQIQYNPGRGEVNLQWFHKPSLLFRWYLSSIQPEGFHRIKSGSSEFLSLHNIELAAAAFFFRIYIVADPGCGQCPSFVKKTCPEFCRDSLVWSAITQVIFFFVPALEQGRQIES